jgi:hypothetical protein
MQKQHLHLKFLLTLCLSLYSIGLRAQQAVVFTIDQPPFFEVKAGTDIISDGVNPVYLSVEVSGGSGSYTYRWSPGNLLDDSTAVSPRVLSLMGRTEFTVVVSDGQCAKSARVNVELSTSSTEIQAESIERIYPQPVREVFHVVSDASSVDLQLIDMTGRIQWQTKGVAPSGPHQLQGIGPGMYILLISQDNQPTQRIKLCKQ